MAVSVRFNGGRYCQVYGYIAPQQQFQLELPVTTYIGRYVQEGCDGFCSGIRHDIPPLGGSCPRVTGNEMAIGADNQGHVAASETDALWAKDDPQLRVSFGYAAPHALAQAAKAIIAAYYGKPPAYSYYDGCSDGGHEALTEAQRYPRDFNGVLAGSPGNIEAQLLAVVPAWVIAVNTGAHGREILTSEKLPALHHAVIKTCGSARGLIEDPRSCGFNPATLRCPPGVNIPSCLTAAQVQVVREFYLGPNDGHGHYLYPGGEPYGSELAWAATAIDPAADTAWPADTAAYQIGINDLKYAAYWHNPPASYQLRDFHFTVAGYRKLLPLAGIYDATDPDLSAFAKAGGKLIIWQGWADESVSPFGTVDYYKAAVHDAGGFRASQVFSRLYMIPGQYHCLTGGSPAVTDNPGLLGPLMRWAERGIAPGTIAFPLVHPTAAMRAIAVRPLNPLNPPPGGTRGLNTRYHWIGKFRPGDELWCRAQGMNLACTHHHPAIGYTPRTSTRN
jgi:feruloyl esterase